MSWVRFPSPAPCPTVLCCLLSPPAAARASGRKEDRTGWHAAHPPQAAAPLATVGPHAGKRRSPSVSRRACARRGWEGALPGARACLPAPVGRKPHARPGRGGGAADAWGKTPSPCALRIGERGAFWHAAEGPRHPLRHSARVAGGRGLPAGEGGAPARCPRHAAKPTGFAAGFSAEHGWSPPWFSAPQRPAARIASARSFHTCCSRMRPSCSTKRSQ